MSESKKATKKCIEKADLEKDVYRLGKKKVREVWILKAHKYMFHHFFFIVKFSFSLLRNNDFILTFKILVLIHAMLFSSLYKYLMSQKELLEDVY